VKAITYSNMQVYDTADKHEVYVIVDIWCQHFLKISQFSVLELICIINIQLHLQVSILHSTTIKWFLYAWTLIAIAHWWSWWTNYTKKTVFQSYIYMHTYHVWLLKTTSCHDINIVAVLSHCSGWPGCRQLHEGAE